MLTRRHFCLGAAALLVGCGLESCDENGPTTPDIVPGEGGTVPDPGADSPGDAAPKRAPSPIGYSNCATLDATEARAVFDAGLTLVLAEALPFGLGPESFDINRLKGIAQVTRQHGGTFMLVLLNWNGLPQQEVSEAWYRDRITQIVQEIGPANIWFEGISEPGNGKHGTRNRAKSIRFQQIALELWPGVDVQNGDDVRADIRDVHHCRYDALLSGVKRGGGTLNNTDCTPILASTLSERQVREVTRAAVRSKARLLMYDTSNEPAGNMEVVRWMSAEL